MENTKHRLILKRGFTLIELLVVIAIISLLSSIVLVSLNSARAKGRDARRLSDIHQIANTLFLSLDSNGGNFPSSGGTAVCIGTSGTCWGGAIAGSASLMTLLQPYLSQLPVDPSRTSGKGDRYLYVGPESVVAKDCDNVGRGTPYPNGPLIIYIPDSNNTYSDDNCLRLGFPACCGAVSCTNGLFCAYKIQ